MAHGNRILHLINDGTKWLVSGAVFGILLWRRDTVAGPSTDGSEVLKLCLDMFGNFPEEYPTILDEQDTHYVNWSCGRLEATNV